MIYSIRGLVSSAFVVALAFGFQAKAQVLNPEVVDVSLSTAYIPTGFDSNDHVQVMVESYLPDTCYKLGPHKVTVDEATRKVTIAQQAYKYKSVCLLMIVPYNHVVDVGILKPGSYDVADGNSSRALGKLPVQESKSSNADDYLYAPVADATVEQGADGSYVLSMSGTFTDSCASLKRVEVNVEGKNVITVLPITDVGGTNCKAGEYPFRHEQKIAGLAKGRYMLHVRSMNGNAVAKLFNAE